MLVKDRMALQRFEEMDGREREVLKMELFLKDGLKSHDIKTIWC